MRENLNRLVSGFGKVCEGRKLKANVGKRCDITRGQDPLRMERVEELREIKYLGSTISRGVKVEVNFSYRLSDVYFKSVLCPFRR